jgi:hypothetical protein
MLTLLVLLLLLLFVLRPLRVVQYHLAQQALAYLS